MTVIESISTRNQKDWLRASHRSLIVMRFNKDFSFLCHLFWSLGCAVSRAGILLYSVLFPKPSHFTHRPDFLPAPAIFLPRGFVWPLEPTPPTDTTSRGAGELMAPGNIPELMTEGSWWINIPTPLPIRWDMAPPGSQCSLREDKLQCLQWKLA